MSSSSVLRTPASAGDLEMPWVLVRAAQGLFAFSTRYVQEMVSTPPVTAVPETQSFVRGVINLRGRVMPLVDFRRRLGLESQVEATQALVELLKAREQDHHRWVEELSASIRDRRPFKLTTDPHACAFGKWYDNFRTDHLLLENVLKRFDAPHQEIHAIGKRAVDAMARGACDRCEALMAEATSTLETLSRLFAEAQQVLESSNREISVVLQGAGQAFAVAVDAIESVERLASDAVSALDETTVGTHSDCVSSIARRARDGRLVLMVAADRLLTAA